MEGNAAYKGGISEADAVILDGGTISDVRLPVTFHGVGPGPLCSALVWSVSDTKVVLSVPLGQVCSSVTDKTALLSAPVHTALQSTETQDADPHSVKSNQERSVLNLRRDPPCGAEDIMIKYTHKEKSMQERGIIWDSM